MTVTERFLKYVQVHTTSDPKSGQHPSFAGEWDLAKLLLEEMKELGMEQLRLDEHCYLYGCLPATAGCEDAAPLGFIAHMDTVDSASGENVKPILHENYDGGEFVYPGSGETLSLKRFPFFASYKGDTLITSDGTTLLGADDKAGVAEILTMIETLQKEKRPHGELWVAFTPDEEIGQGTDLFDFPNFPARFAYTVDGGKPEIFEYENFNAASAELKFKGISVHPGSAKNKMINAQIAAMDYFALLPAQERPEHTSDHEGFFYLGSFEGTVSAAEMSILVRDHDMAKFEARKALLREAADTINAKYGEGTVTLEIKDSYYNMYEMILPHRHLINNAHLAIERAGMVPEDRPIRGGTDGARLSYNGLPCPNLGTGCANAHGLYECITVGKMEKVVKILLELADIYKDPAALENK